MKRSLMIIAVFAVFGSVTQVATAADGQAVYDKDCAGCHDKGRMKALKLTEKEKWAPLIKQGQPAMVEAVIKGKGKMEPKGGNDSLTVDEIRAAVAYMISKVQ